jgi:hypothetical protein
MVKGMGWRSGLSSFFSCKGALMMHVAVVSLVRSPVKVTSHSRRPSFSHAAQAAAARSLETGGRALAACRSTRCCLLHDSSEISG